MVEMADKVVAEAWARAYVSAAPAVTVEMAALVETAVMAVH
jgi:hypothetical protein